MATYAKKSNKTNNFQKMSNTYPCNLLLDLFPNITKVHFVAPFIQTYLFYLLFLPLL